MRSTLLVMAFVALVATSLMVLHRAGRETTTRTGTLELLVDTPTRISAHYTGRHDDVVRVEAFEHPRGVVTLMLFYSGALFELTFDQDTQDVTWLGHEAVIRSRDRALLRELSDALWPRLGLEELRTAAELPLVRRALFIVSFLAEAPDNLHQRDFTMNLKHPQGHQPCTEDSPNWCECTQSCLRARLCEKRELERSCIGDQPAGGAGGVIDCATTYNSPGDDGVTLLSQCCGVGGGVQPMSAIERHDACQHAMLSASTQCGWLVRSNGLRQNECEGRCGEQCKSAPVYTQDCLDHDMCEFHRLGHVDAKPGGLGTHPDCGDEFWEAADDTLRIYLLFGWADFCPGEPVTAWDQALPTRQPTLEQPQLAPPRECTIASDDWCDCLQTCISSFFCRKREDEGRCTEGG